MPNVLHRSGALTVTIDNLWQKHSKGPYYYRRRVPKDIALRLGKRMRQVALKTYDKMAAAKMIDRLAKADDAHWRQLRAGIGLGGARGDAERLLERFNLEPEPATEQTGPYADIGHELFIESLEAKVPGDAKSIQPYFNRHGHSRASFLALPITYTGLAPHQIRDGGYGGKRVSSDS